MDKVKQTLPSKQTDDRIKFEIDAEKNGMTFVNLNQVFVKFSLKEFRLFGTLFYNNYFLKFVINMSEKRFFSEVSDSFYQTF